MALSGATNVAELRPVVAAMAMSPEYSGGQASGVSWGAILAGAASSAALSLILLMLGIGLGLSSVSPWAHGGPAPTTFGLVAILWITLTQLVASGMGGYLAGRLRTKWIAVHTDEVYFRDTAHGFLAWAVASLSTAALLTSAIGSIINSGSQTGATGSSRVSSSAGAAEVTDITNSDRYEGTTRYYVDLLFRRNTNSEMASANAGMASMANSLRPIDMSEARNIFINANREGPLPAEDLKYLGETVARRTGLTQQDAEKRVIDTYARMHTRLLNAETTENAAAEKARKASAYVALWLFISLLIGAFVASLAATYGGRRRDA